MTSRRAVVRYAFLVVFSVFCFQTTRATALTLAELSTQVGELQFSHDEKDPGSSYLELLELLREELTRAHYDDVMKLAGIKQGGAIPMSVTDFLGRIVLVINTLALPKDIKETVQLHLEQCGPTYSSQIKTQYTKVLERFGITQTEISSDDHLNDVVGGHFSHNPLLVSNADKREEFINSWIQKIEAMENVLQKRLATNAITKGILTKMQREDSKKVERYLEYMTKKLLLLLLVGDGKTAASLHLLNKSLIWQLLTPANSAKRLTSSDESLGSLAGLERYKQVLLHDDATFSRNAPTGDLQYWAYIADPKVVCNSHDLATIYLLQPFLQIKQTLVGFCKNAA